MAIRPAFAGGSGPSRWSRATRSCPATYRIAMYRTPSVSLGVEDRHDVGVVDGGGDP